MESHIAAPQGCVPTLRANLDSLADMANTLYALYRLAETRPDTFHDYRRLALSESGDGVRLNFILQEWPGRATAKALQTGAEASLARLHDHALADGAVLCAGTLLDNLRIVGGLYVTANQRDPATFRRCADERLVSHWLNAVCETQVEYPEVIEVLQYHDRSLMSSAGEAADPCLQLHRP